MTHQLQEQIRAAAQGLERELIDFRRDLHAHPEVGYEERRTTARVKQRLERAGLSPRVLRLGTGLVCDIEPDGPVDPPARTRPHEVQHQDGVQQPAGIEQQVGTPQQVGTSQQDRTPQPGGPEQRAAVRRGRVGLRADLDALPITDGKDVGYASTVAGRAHACGHDVHTTVVLGAGLVLARLREQGLLSNRVRLIFQPAEEASPGGAPKVIAEGALQGLDEIYALHCDPRTDIGQLAVKKGAITSAADRVRLSVYGPGGHTSRPHTTADVVTALGVLISQAPLVLSRRLDPRSGTSLIWGHVEAGTAENAIPRTGVLGGTLRTLTIEGWQQARAVLPDVLEQLVAPYGVGLEVDLDEGLPPTVNDPAGVDRMIDAAQSQLGRGSVTRTEQSLGGEDFSWMLQKVPGAMARLGVRTPGAADWPDIHRPAFDVDERCIQIGVQALSRLAAVGLARTDQRR